MLKQTGIVGIVFLVVHSLLMQEAALVYAATPQLPPHVPNQMLVKYSEQAEWVLFGDNDIANQVNPSIWQTLLALFSQSKPNEEEIAIFKEFATLKEELGIVKQTPLSKSPRVNREYHAIQLSSFDPNGGDDLLENIYLVEFTNGDVAAAWEKVKALDFVLLSQPNYKYFPTAVPNDPGYPRQASAYRHTMLEEAWDITTGEKQAGGRDIIIAILDSGLKGKPADIIDNLVPGVGYDVLSDDSDPDDSGSEVSHGTKVASIVGAVGNNGTMISGVAWDTQLMMVRVYETDASREIISSNLLKGLEYAFSHNARIINMSYGSDGQPNLLGNCVLPSIEAELLETIAKSGVLLVASAGNNSESSECHFPSNLPSVLAGTSSNSADGPSVGFSNYAPFEWKEEKVLAAPGDNVLAIADDSNNVYVVIGTSYSAPFIAGAAALMLSVKPDLTGQQIMQILIDTADEMTGSDFEKNDWLLLSPKKYTYGKRINVHCALATAVGKSCTITPTPTPTTPVKSPTPTRPDRVSTPTKTPYPTVTNTSPDGTTYTPTPMSSTSTSPTNTPTPSLVPTVTPVTGPPIPTLLQGQVTLQVDWTVNGEGKCWSAWATNACQLTSHEGGASQAGRDLDSDGVVDVTCSQSTGDRRTTTITNVSTKTFPVRCERYTCNSCKSGNGTHAQCDGYIDPTAGEAGKDAIFQLTPGCVATCTIDGIYKNSCL